MDSGAESYRKYLAGDDEGLVELVRDYKDGLMLYLNCYVRNIHTAEQLMSDTFFKLMTKKPVFRGESSFRTWLYAIGRNEALSCLRKCGRHPEVPWETVEPFLEDRAEIEEAVLVQERHRALYSALSEIPAEYAQTIYLKYLEGFGNEAIGESLGISRRQVENLLYRAKQALKRKLEKGGWDDEELS